MNTQTPYFNETGPIYQEEYVQAKEFVKLVRAHVVVTADKNLGNNNLENEKAWFDWEAFRAAAVSMQASDLSTEHDFTATVPPRAYIGPVGTGSDVEDTTIQAVLDALITRFASAFTDVLFIDGDDSPKSHFFSTLRRNLYHAFTRHLAANDVPERFLSFHTSSSAGHPMRSAWEYRLLFVHPDKQLGTVKGLVMTVRLEGNFQSNDGDHGKEGWYSVSLDSRGPFSGTLRAMQVAVGEGFRCP